MKPRAPCEACLVRSTAMCRVLSEDALLRLSRLTVHRRVPAGRLVALSSAGPDGVATIMSGVIKTVRSLEDGRQQIVALNFAGDFIGGLPDEADQVVAATDVELCCLDRAHFSGLTEAHPQLLADLHQRTLSDLNDAREWMLLLGRKTAEERLASFFLMLAERLHPPVKGGRNDAPVPVRLPISRSDIADFLGLTIETVSRQIHRLNDAGIIQIRRQRDILVPNIQRLRREAGHEST